VRQAISTFSKATRAAGIDRLRDDLETGEWQRRHGALLTQDSLDLGYRLLVVNRSGAPG
jgi:hypothetical protein